MGRIITLLLFLLLTPPSIAWSIKRNNVHSIRSQSIHKSISFSSTLVSVSVIAFQLLGTTKVNAVQGQVKASDLSETKAAILQVTRCRDAAKLMQMLAEKGEFQKIADLLVTKDFTTLGDAFNIIVRSDYLLPEDKVALGTIKRYGVVADALIMIGGLSAELRSGGLNLPDVGGLQEAIVSDEDEEKVKAEVNVDEVKKYAKLSEGSLADILKIVSPILTK